MATVNKILLPRRGKKSIMATSKADTVLEKGELFVESSDEGIGVGHAKIKIGDGTTAYANLGYALGDTSNDIISFTDTAETDITIVIERIKTESKLETLIKNIKKAIQLLKSNDDIINGKIINLTAGGVITEVKIVNTLPSDAASHPNTLYLIRS